MITIRSFFPFVVAVFAVVFAPPLLMAVPTEIARESFEGTGIGFTTSVPQFDEPTVPTSDFFSVQPNNGTKLSGGMLAGGDLANMFAAEDIDTIPGPGVGPTQFFTTNGVNIAGKTNTSVKILLSAPGTGPAAGGNAELLRLVGDGGGYRLRPRGGERGWRAVQPTDSVFAHHTTA